MGQLGLQGLLEHQHSYGESPTETVPSLWWAKVEQYSPLRMEPLGFQGLLVRQALSGEPHTGEAHSPCPLGKAIPLLPDNTEKDFKLVNLRV